MVQSMSPDSLLYYRDASSRRQSRSAVPRHRHFVSFGVISRCLEPGQRLDLSECVGKTYNQSPPVSAYI